MRRKEKKKKGQKERAQTQFKAHTKDGFGNKKIVQSKRMKNKMRLLKLNEERRKQCKEMRNKLKVKPKNFSVDNEQTDRQY